MQCLTQLTILSFFKFSSPWTFLFNCKWTILFWNPAIIKYLKLTSSFLWQISYYILSLTSLVQLVHDCSEYSLTPSLFSIPTCGQSCIYFSLIVFPKFLLSVPLLPYLSPIIIPLGFESTSWFHFLPHCSLIHLAYCHHTNLHKATLPTNLLINHLKLLITSKIVSKLCLNLPFKLHSYHVSLLVFLSWSVNPLTCLHISHCVCLSDSYTLSCCLFSPLSFL